MVRAEGTVRARAKGAATAVGTSDPATREGRRGGGSGEKGCGARWMVVADDDGRQPRVLRSSDLHC